MNQLIGVLTIGTRVVDSQNPSTMNPPTKISPSTQFLLDEINRRFDEQDAKWDARLARLGATWGVRTDTPLGVDVRLFEQPPRELTTPSPLMLEAASSIVQNQ